MTVIPQPVSATPGSARGTRLRSLAMICWSFVTVAGLLLPQVVSTFYLALLISAVLLAISAVGIGFLLRYCGLVMFGVAAFIGLPAYLLGISLMVLKLNITVAVLVALLGSALFALLVGALIVRARPLPFTMLTLALGQMLKSVVTLQTLRSVTGGDDGLSVTFSGSFMGMMQADYLHPTTFWYPAWLTLALAILVLSIAGHSRFGQVLSAIKANEERMRFSGFNTYGPRLAAFVLCCIIISLSGVLMTLNSGFISPDLLDFGFGGNALLAMLIGGGGSVLGPVVGALLHTWGQNLFGTTGHLELLTGIGVIVVISLFPAGLIGLAQSFSKMVSKLQKRREGKHAENR